MKRIVFCILMLCLLASSCVPRAAPRTENADEELVRILSERGITGGTIYSRAADAECSLTDAMLERLFFGSNTEDLRYVRSMALYTSGRMNEGEIFVLELYDLSHKEAVRRLLSYRAEKKENAVLSENGVYLYLLCEP